MKSVFVTLFDFADVRARAKCRAWLAGNFSPVRIFKRDFSIQTSNSSNTPPCEQTPRAPRTLERTIRVFEQDVLSLPHKPPLLFMDVKTCEKNSPGHIHTEEGGKLNTTPVKRLALTPSPRIASNTPTRTESGSRHVHNCLGSGVASSGNLGDADRPTQLDVVAPPTDLDEGEVYHRPTSGKVALYPPELFSSFSPVCMCACWKLLLFSN